MNPHGNGKQHTCSWSATTLAITVHFITYLASPRQHDPGWMTWTVITLVLYWVKFCHVKIAGCLGLQAEIRRTEGTRMPNDIKPLLVHLSYLYLNNQLSATEVIENTILRLFKSWSLAWLGHLSCWVGVMLNASISNCQCCVNKMAPF